MKEKGKVKAYDQLLLGLDQAMQPVLAALNSLEQAQEEKPLTKSQSCGNQAHLNKARLSSS